MNRKKPFKLHAQFAVFIALSLIILGILVYTQFIAPAPFYIHNDPEDAYFFTALYPFIGQPYYYVQHPNLPVNFLSTFFMAVTYIPLKLLGQDVISFHLSNPEIFLTMGHCFLTFSALIPLYFLTVKIIPAKNFTDVAFIAAVGMSYFSDNSWSFRSLRHWGHNSFPFIWGTVIWIFLYFILQSDKKFSTKQLILLGLGAGIITGVQIIQAPWIVGILVTINFFYLLNNAKAREILQANLIFCGSTLLAFFLPFISAGKNSKIFFDFIYEIATHLGQYGGGETGFITLDIIEYNFSHLWSKNGFLVISLAILFVFFVVLAFINRRKLKENIGSWALVSGITIQTILVFLLILKKYGDRYPLVMTAMFPLLLVLAYSLIKKRTKFHSLIFIAISLVIASQFFVTLYEDLKEFGLSKEILENRNEDFNSFVNAFSRDHQIAEEEMLIAWGYGTNGNECYFYWHGNSYVRRSFSENILEVCENEWMLGFNAEHITNGLKYYGIDEIDWDIIIVDTRWPERFPIVNEYGDVYRSQSGLVFITR